MWLFTKCGFYSVVTWHKPKGSMAIRARMREHLITLQKRFSATIGDSVLQESQHTDYPYRLIVSREIWKDIAERLTDEIDYNNFKGECTRGQGEGDYVRALHKVWGVMRELQWKEKQGGESSPPPKPSPKRGKRLRLPPTKP